MKKVLIAYFSHEGEAYVGGKIVKLKIGNTRVAAQMIHGLTGGDVFRIETEKPYPDEHMETVELAKSEQNAKARLVLKADALKMDDYDTVILGYPNWWGTCPMAVFTILEGHDFFGKTILPLCTHEGSGMGRSETDIQAACPGAKEEKGLADEMKRMITDRAYYEKYGRASAKRAQDFNNESYAERLMGWIVDCVDE